MPDDAGNSVTARCVWLTYGEKTSATLRLRSESVSLRVDNDDLSQSRAVRDAINVIGAEDRMRLTGEVILTLKHSLLERGLQIVDTPGFSENRQIDSVMASFLRDRRRSVVFVLSRVIGQNVPLSLDEKLALKELSKLPSHCQVLMCVFVFLKGKKKSYQYLLLLL